MNSFLHMGQLATLSRLRRLVIILLASLVVMLMATACAPSDTTASQMDVPEATPADVQRAQSNLSDQAVNEDVLSQQGASQARRSDSASIQ